MELVGENMFWEKCISSDIKPGGRTEKKTWVHSEGSMTQMKLQPMALSTGQRAVINDENKKTKPTSPAGFI